MSKKNANPYGEKSTYHKLFANWKKSQVTTRSKMLEAAKEMGMSESAAKATVTVLLSPRQSAEHVRPGADFRGNFSAKGHVYYAEKLQKKKGEEQRFRLRYRKEVLEANKRPAKVTEEVAPVKEPVEAGAVQEEVSDPVEA